MTPPQVKSLHPGSPLAHLPLPSSSCALNPQGHSLPAWFQSGTTHLQIPQWFPTLGSSKQRSLGPRTLPNRADSPDYLRLKHINDESPASSRHRSKFLCCLTTSTSIPFHLEWRCPPRSPADTLYMLLSLSQVPATAKKLPRLQE